MTNFSAASGFRAGFLRLAAAAIAVALTGLMATPVVPDRPPSSRQPLITAASDVQANRVWDLPDADGHGLTGRGVTVCDVDSGIDIFHPMFFRADGGVFAWLDRDGDGVWSPGDAVDLDGNGVATQDEILTWLPAAALADGERDTTRFQPGYDFLFLDADGDGLRDFGPGDFTEQDLCYGERLFLADDTDGDGFLGPGETLVGLGTSKIKAVYWQRIYRRGVDLIEAPTFDSYHGTPVCGIVAGGWPGLHRYTGVAPDADLLVSMEDAGTSLLWARAEGADIVLYEHSGDRTDGSDWLDALVDELAGGGIIFVAAAGNRRLPRIHASFEDGAVRELENLLPDHFGIEFFWTGDPPPALRLEDPAGRSVTLDVRRQEYREDGWRIGLSLGETWRGTEFCVLHVIGSSAHPITGRWRISLPGASGMVHGLCTNYYMEERTWWPEGDGRFTVTSPGTADSAVTVAAYENDGLRDMAWFSGEGPRLDGRPAVDIAAPGVRVVTAAGEPWPVVPVEHPERPQFTVFTGTSASAPFVAGAAALLKQAFPDLDSGGFRSLLCAGAERDSLTGNADRWGAGRLRIRNSLAAGLRREARNTNPARLEVAGAPNPTTGPARISWLSTGSPLAEVRVFSVNGRLVWETTTVPAGGRLAWVDWDGRDRFGTSTPAGVYFAHVREGSRTGTARLVRIR